MFYTLFLVARSSSLSLDSIFELIWFEEKLLKREKKLFKNYIKANFFWRFNDQLASASYNIPFSVHEFLCFATCHPSLSITGKFQYCINKFQETLI